MDRRQQRALAAQWAGLGAYFRQPLSDQVAQWYAADLADLPYDEVVGALASLRREPSRRFLPMPSEVRERLAIAFDRTDTAVEIAARIRAAIGRFGYTNPEGAREHVGPIGWDVVSQMGGWCQLCQTLKASEMGTFYAQCRDLSRTLLARAQARRDLLDGSLALRSAALTALPS